MNNKPKRILYIMHDLSLGGIQSFTLHLIKSLPRNEYVPSLLYYDEITSMKDEFEELGIPIYHFSNKKISKRYFQFKNQIKQIDPDLIHFQGHEGMFTMFLWLRLAGFSKVINTFHSTHFNEISFSEIIKEGMVQFFVSKIVHVAKETEVRYSKMFKTMKSKHTTIYNGIDTYGIHSKANLCNKFPEWDGYFNIIGVANFHPQKGYQIGIPVIHSLIKKYPNIKYHIIGDSHGNNAIKIWIESYIKENKLKNNIILHGQQNDVIPFLKNSDIFFSPSDKELMPISILEAMACGIPIIATDTGGVPEIIGRNNEWGILCKIGNISQMKTAIESLINNDSLRNEYKVKSLERIKKFSIDLISKQYINLYEEILNF